MCAKHFIGQGGAAGGHMFADVPVGIREMRDIHLVPAKAAIEAGADIHMVAYNSIDGVLCVANAAVEEFCSERGIDVPNVSVTLGDEKYPRRYYEGLAFPSGTYHSLRVIIGEGEGENWWCVLFPPLCFSAASEPNDSDFISVGLTPDQYNVISGEKSPKYRIRFRIIEWIEELFSDK
jgi:hypothetical protein